jgi:hypothetical protein
LFYFLHRELGLSKSAAFQRMTAAQLIHKYPEVVEPLRDGRLCLSTVTEVSPTPPLARGRPRGRGAPGRPPVIARAGRRAPPGDLL